MTVGALRKVAAYPFYLYIRGCIGELTCYMSRSQEHELVVYSLPEKLQVMVRTRWFWCATWIEWTRDPLVVMTPNLRATCDLEDRRLWVNTQQVFFSWPWIAKPRKLVCKISTSWLLFHEIGSMAGYQSLCQYTSISNDDRRCAGKSCPKILRSSARVVHS